MKLKVYTDGGSRGNPGIAGVGVYITDEKGNEMEKKYKSLGMKTNNEAEYLGVLYGIERAIELQATEIELLSDSSLVIEQLSGNWRIRKEELKKISVQITELIKKNNIKIKFTWIARTENKEADKLSNVAMNLNS